MVTITAALVLIALCANATADNSSVLATNFTRPRWKASDDMFTDYKNVSGSNPWNPQFVEDCRVYSCIRNMDADHINGSNRSGWNQRPRKADRTQSPIAYEWIIDMCNRIGADMWVCIPHLTVNRHTGDKPCDYALRLAILAKTGVDMKSVDLGGLGELSTLSADDFVAAGGTRTTPPLNENLKLYLEYSNETWNTNFGQSEYCRAEGQALDLDANVDNARRRFHAWAAVRIFRAAELVFGPDSPRIVNVLAGHAPQLGELGHQFNVVESAEHNPWGINADAMAIAPYIGHGATTVSELPPLIPTVTSTVARNRRLADTKGVKLLCYEAGQHIWGTPCIAASNDPMMYDVYREYLDSLSRYCDLIAHFSQVGIWGNSGCWGAKRYTGQSLAQAHKYRALVHFSSQTTALAPPMRLFSAERARTAPASVFSLSGRAVHPPSAAGTNELRVVSTPGGVARPRLRVGSRVGASAKRQ